MELRMVASGKPGKSFYCSAASLSMNVLTSARNSSMRSVIDLVIFMSFLGFLDRGERLCLFKLFLSFR